MREQVRTAKSAWGVRVALARMGWHSKTDLRLHPGSSAPWFSAWVERWDWRGYPTDRVCFQAGGAIDPDDPEAAARMLAFLRRAAVTAVDAWDAFVDAVPRQCVDGSASVDPIATEWSFAKGPPRRGLVYPTEDLPEDPSVLCDAPGREDATLQRALAFAERGIAFEDNLTTFRGFNPEHAHRFRRWGYEATLTETSWHAVRTRAHWTRHRVDEILESYVGSVLDGIATAHDRLASAYGPGGPLPPGRVTMAEFCVRNEIDLRRRELRRLDPEDGWSAGMLAGLWAARRDGDRHVSSALPPVDEAEVLRCAAILDTSLADAGSLRTWPCREEAAVLAVPAAKPRP